MTAEVFCQRLSDGEDPRPVLERLLSDVGGLGDVGPGDRVLLKPNFVAPFSHATTDLAIIDFFAGEARKRGATPVLGESSGFEFDTGSTFRVLGVDVFAKRTGLEVVDLATSSYREVSLGLDLPSAEISEEALRAKLIVNLPVLKGHTVTRMSCAVKNSFGLVSRERRRFLHSHDLEASIAAISKTFPNVLHFVDARRKLRRAVFAESEPLGYMLAGRDAFALDHFGARLLGIEPESVKHLAGAPRYEVRGVMPDEFPEAERRDSPREKAHRALYAALYWIDETKSRALGGRSILHDLHWYLGIHPVLGDVPPERAQAVAASCPVGAIDARARHIDKQKCQKVRCLHCYREHGDLVSLGGLNRPRRLNIDV